MLKRSLQFTSWLFITVVSCHTWAAAEAADASNALVGGSGVSTGQVFTVLAGLAFVLLLVFGCGWLVKRFSGMSDSVYTGSRSETSWKSMGQRDIVDNCFRQNFSRRDSSF